MKQQWEIYVIQHSHTDIGYTERQERITRYHRDYIRQAMQILDARAADAANVGFKWQCENYWQVKEFLSDAAEEEKSKFAAYVKSGDIGLSGNYLNLTELADYAVLSSKIGEARDYGARIGCPVKSGMTADINGYAWGYADALAENGVENLASCLHTHHGMFACNTKQRPFWWRSPKGNRVLVWMGEHYNLGNELCFAPNANCSYMVRDEFIGKWNLYFHEDAATTEEQELAIGTERVTRYLNNLEQEGYPVRFVPVMVSGIMTDNAAPNARIPERLRKLEKRLGNRVRLRMATLDDFFARVRADYTEIPEYAGDWPDWWADGVGSTPAAVKTYLDAQRKYTLCEKLDPARTVTGGAAMSRAADDLMLYAEHTWGYSSSTGEPWDSYVNDLDLKKTACAVNAHTLLSDRLDAVLAAKGDRAIRACAPLAYRVINPNPYPVETTAMLYVEYWQYLEGAAFEFGDFEVVDCESGETLAAQPRYLSRAVEVETTVKLAADETKRLLIRRKSDRKGGTDVNVRVRNGSEGVADVVLDGDAKDDLEGVDTAFFRVRFGANGLASCVDAATGKELLRADAPAAFSGVYEFTPVTDGNYCGTRTRMGRNRKANATRRDFARLVNLDRAEAGEVSVTYRLDYELNGTKFYRVFLKVYRALPRIEAKVCVHKESVWEPENLYVSLPFTLGENETKYIDKTGCVVRPGIDQLPGTNQEFYLLRNGLAIESEDRTLTIGCKDAPLVTFGGLAARPIRLCDGGNAALNRAPAYSWPMNNYWETNFKVDLGGFYEFRYVLLLGEEKAETALARAADDLCGVPVARI